MRTVLLRGLATRRARTALSVFAVVLGVALVTGALTLGGALRSASGQLKTSAYDGTAAVVSAPRGFTSDDLSANATIPARTAAHAAHTAGVDVALGEIVDEAKVIGGDGRPVGGGPYFGVGLDAASPGAGRVSPFRLVAGHWAHGPGRVVVDQGTAQSQGLHVGSPVRIAAAGPAQRFTVAGIVRFGTVRSLGTASVTMFDLHTAQALFGKPGRIDEVLVAGAGAAALRARLADDLGPAVAVQTARAHDRFELVSGLDEVVSVLGIALLVFGGIAVLVGAMTIANALGLTVAQRSRELALLRATGASRRQVRRSVTAEAAIIGATGSGLGIAAGFGLAAGLLALMGALGVELPSTGLTLGAGTVVVAVATGLGTTLLASLAPALRATRVAPVEAMREGASAAGGARSSRRGTVAGVAFALVGLGIVAYALTAPDKTSVDRLIAVAPGAVALLAGVALLLRHLVTPLAAVLGRPGARVAGVAGRLAQGNTMRNPRRTASTTAALMVGVALVTFVAVLASGLKSAAGGDIRATVRSEQVITGADGWSPVSPGVVAAAHKAGATTVAALAVDEARAGTAKTTVMGVDPATFAKVYSYRYAEGGPADLWALKGDGALVRADFATAHHLHAGSRFTVTAADGGRLALRVRAIVEGSPIDPLGLGQVTVARPAFDGTFAQRRPKLVLVSGAPAAALDRALAPFPDAERLTPGALAAEVEASVDSALSMVTVLLALAVIISVLGIVTTLALGVTERTRELGLLRAAGMTRRQMRRMVRLEGALTAAVGATLGVGLGLGLGAAVTLALADQGLVLSVPVVLLAVYVANAALAGVAAAALPARRAGRLPVLGALAHT